MRPTRLLLSLCSVILTILLTFYSLLYSHPRNDVTTATTVRHSSAIKSFFSFHTPSTLFPPSAIISLTDDNSTFFLSRPADFGPGLPSDGLSGQLWIGSGFGEDSLARGGVNAKSEGELGCSDIPGWAAGHIQHAAETSDEMNSETNGGRSGGDSRTAANGHRSNHPKRSPKGISKSPPPPREDDGTDDFLQYPLKGAPLFKGRRPGKQNQVYTPDNKLEHADIQSLQESAEIGGKVVLLSRGGCGFLEKVKWVQRRGGVALIVGDNTRGGPLITMYARGDTSNVSIPSLFTSRTTAHLLSSLIPSGNGEGADESKKPDRIPTKIMSTKNGGTKAKDTNSRPTFTQPSSLLKGSGPTKNSKAEVDRKTDHKSVGLFRSLASKLGLARGNGKSGLNSESSRPPSSGRINWVVSEDWDDEPVPVAEIPTAKEANEKSSKSKGKSKGKSSTEEKYSSNKENFVIGVQDWRDPDIVDSDSKQASQGSPGSSKKSDASAKTSSATTQNRGNTQNSDKALTGGSITPGSGVYHQPGAGDIASESKALEKASSNSESNYKDSQGKGWVSQLFGGSNSQDDAIESNKKAQDIYKNKIAPHFVKEKEFETSADHEGLWVTMTPASMSTTPFFDTLLVLVVSPLVTLTVVYALLLLRSRIRRRRWRAPKSVVERLPVRTYHTMSCSSSSTSSQTPSPNGSSPTSPLLQSDSRSILTRTRPRSRTTASVLAEQASASLDKATARASLGRERSTWPQKYRGRQVECVVCLEEYIDGQSRVMSLPCGHEFHADTPWLTTRRRTCPICKGDVVRSVRDNSGNASSSSSSGTNSVSLMPPYHDIPDADDVQAEAAETRNESPSSAIPIPRGSPDDPDLERGDDMAATLVNDRPEAYNPRQAWRELASRSLSVISGEGSWRQNQADRSR